MSNTDQTNLLNNLKDIAQKAGLDISEELAKINAKLESSTALSKTWERVELARHSDRPRTLDYINLIFDNFTELHGDRFFGDDPAMIGGIGFIDGMPVTVIGTQKGRNLRETIDRNGGMANPEGYRKAMRLAKQAEKFKRPIITFIDTQGAYPGLGAEERGIGEAIAFNLREFSRLKTPVICIIIGEGGSGGALGIGVGDKIYMLENAIFSVISPEGCASILLRDSSRAKDAAAMLKITSQEVLDLKVINGIIPEPEKGAHIDPKQTAEAIKQQILKDLADLTKRDPAVLVKYRSKKIRSIGKYSE
ncbi:acetyl-CoA carboxylase carboxyltransferase subunit alpha [Treponema sp. OMZ 788]|uniref:acetyl-CoA carboxylase carboxyltransferase subunit alpha n=1 Tax=unclassified Treponema TaxID=2638727 RepID=UPI0020A4BED6|nr:MULTISPECIES: acetyl-CoA carboxylase carboxyltransferase subunit alpha [unclassified Treponema]UTC62830.1 acetyl-CoA carboxylase carboxyltransferase subunit alpha [Treponema sp. OMZ 787]UTC64305.1 acetyl-CoA carboxylase carboxyltransferase subunit alpha [Treponema sp. OMZ 788]